MVSTKKLFILFNCILFFQVAADAQIAKFPADTVYSVVEQMPEFPGGQDSLFKYLQRNINFPEKERNAGVEGRVYIQFTVYKDGSLGNVAEVKGVPGGPGLSKEAIRVIKAIPVWNPGRQDGKPVNVSMVLPIKFFISPTANSIDILNDSLEKAEGENFFKKVNGLYVNFDFHFSIHLPEYYKYRENYSSNQLYSFNSNISKDSLEIIAVSLEKKGENLSSLNIDIMNGLEKKLKIIGEIKSSDFNLADYQTIKNVYMVNFSGRKSIVTTYVFITRKFTFDISTSTYIENYERVKSKMEDIVKTFFVE
jgi:TonB family protein